MKQNSSREMERRNATKCFVFKVFIARFATRTKGLVSVLGAGALLAPTNDAQSATVFTSLFQSGNNVDMTNTSINYTIINDDIGATYNSATLDLNGPLSSVVDSIVANNPNFNTPEQVYGNMAFDISTTGNVHLGWSGNINPVSGVVNITNTGGIPNVNYTSWTSA